MKYRIVESQLGTCRIQVRGKLPFTWVFVKRKVGDSYVEGDTQWRVWTGTYAEAYEKCMEMEMRQNILRYYYPPLPPPLPKAPEKTNLPYYEPPLAPPYHPGPGAILLNERSQ